MNTYFLLPQYGITIFMSSLDGTGQDKSSCELFNVDVHFSSVFQPQQYRKKFLLFLISTRANDHRYCLIILLFSSPPPLYAPCSPDRLKLAVCGKRSYY